jgi:hypothetical protein
MILRETQTESLSLRSKLTAVERELSTVRRSAEEVFKIYYVIF